MFLFVWRKCSFRNCVYFVFWYTLHFLVAFQKKCRLLHLHLWLGQSEEKISIVLTFLVVKFNCLKTSCVLTFLTYRFYFLLNLTIFFFTYFFLECFIRLDLSTLVPLNLVPSFFIFFLNLHFLKGKQTVELDF